MSFMLPGHLGVGGRNKTQKFFFFAVYRTSDSNKYMRCTINYYFTTYCVVLYFISSNGHVKNTVYGHAAAAVISVILKCFIRLY